MRKYPKSIVIFAGIILVLGTVCLYLTKFSPIKIQHTLAEYYVYNDINELSDNADFIIIARPEKSFEELKPTIKYNAYGRLEDFYTVSSIKPLKVIKGDPAIKNINVLEPAILTESLLSGRILMITGDYYSVMKKNNKYLLFLKKVRDQNIYSVISLEYGKYNLDGIDKDEIIITEKSQSYKKIKDQIKAEMGQIYNSVN